MPVGPWASDEVDEVDDEEFLRENSGPLRMIGV